MTRALVWVPIVLAAACSDGGSPPPAIDAPPGQDAQGDTDAVIFDAADPDASTLVDAGRDGQAPPDGPPDGTIGSCVVGAEVLGLGAGRVVSAPAGINCAPDCRETVTCGTTMTLTALATPPSTFGGWSGACTGTGACTVTAIGPLTLVFATFQ